MQSSNVTLDYAMQIVIDLEKFNMVSPDLLEVRGERLYNRYTRSYQCFFHGNGNGKGLYSQFVKTLRLTGGEETLESREIASAECKDWRHRYSVVPGRSWGSLPGELQLKWTENECDRFF